MADLVTRRSLAASFALLVAGCLAGCVVVVPVGAVRDAPVAQAATAATPGTLQVQGFGAALNAARLAEGLPPLAENARYAAAAQAHADDMARSGQFSHQGSDGSRLGDRVRAQGCTYRLLAENIAFGQRSEPQVLAGWLGSPGHRRNIMAARADAYGLGQAGTFWVLVLGQGC